MKIKCDSCQHQKCDSNNWNDTDIYCSKGHWKGLGYPDDPDNSDGWVHCKDYKSIDQIKGE